MPQGVSRGCPSQLSLGQADSVPWGLPAHPRPAGSARPCAYLSGHVVRSHAACGGKSEVSVTGVPGGSGSLALRPQAGTVKQVPYRRSSHTRHSQVRSSWFPQDRSSLPPGAWSSAGCYGTEVQRVREGLGRGAAVGCSLCGWGPARLPSWQIPTQTGRWAPPGVHRPGTPCETGSSPLQERGTHEGHTLGSPWSGSAAHLASVPWSQRAQASV